MKKYILFISFLLLLCVESYAGAPPPKTQRVDGFFYNKTADSVGFIINGGTDTVMVMKALGADGQVLKLDLAGKFMYWANDAGAAGGDNVTFDTGNGVEAIIDPVIRADSVVGDTIWSYTQTAAPNYIKSKQWFNVKDFGAVGDSATDDYDSIQVVLDSIGVLGGGTAYFPKGTYRSTSTLMYDSNTYILGTGFSKIYYNPGYDTSTYTTDGAALLSKSFDTTAGGAFFITKNVTIENMTIETAPDTGNGIGIVRAENVSILNCKTTQLEHHLVDIVGSRKVIVDGNIMRTTGSGAIQIDNGTSGGAIGRGYGSDSVATMPVSSDSGRTSNIIVSNNLMTACVRGVHFHRAGGRDILVTNNIFDSCGTSGFGAIFGDNEGSLKHWSNVSIVGNVFKGDSVQNGVAINLLRSSDLDSILYWGLNISDNIIKGGRHGILVSSSHYVNIQGNTIDSLSDTGKTSVRGVTLSHSSGRVADNILSNIGWNHSGDNWDTDTSFGSRTEAMALNLSLDSGLIVVGNVMRNIYGTGIGYSSTGGLGIISNNWVENSGVGLRLLDGAGSPHSLNIVNNSFKAGAFSWYGIYDNTSATTLSLAGSHFYGTFGTEQSTWTANETYNMGNYNLPNVDGSNGQVLTTDGSGAVTWGAGGGGGSIDSAGVLEQLTGLDSILWNVDKPWALRFMNGLTTLHGDSSGIDTIPVEVDTTILASLNALNDSLNSYFDSAQVVDTILSSLTDANIPNDITIQKADTGEYLGLDTGRVLLTDREDTMANRLTMGDTLDADSNTILNVENLDFSILVNGGEYKEGRIVYSADADGHIIYNSEADISGNVLREGWTKVRNVTGVTILNGSAVYLLSTGSGDLPRIGLAQADDTATSKVAGLVTHDIENETDGFVTVRGEVRDLATDTLEFGDDLFLSATTAGAYSTARPAIVVPIGKVERVHASEGVILVQLNHSVIDTSIVFGLQNYVEDRITDSLDSYYDTAAVVDTIISTEKPASTIKLDTLDAPAFSDVQQMQNTFHSTGWMIGGTITTGAANTVNITAGEGNIRASDNDTITLFYFAWAESLSLAIPDDSSIYYLGVEYNAGTPRIFSTASLDNFDDNTSFELGSAINEGGAFQIVNDPHAVGNHAGKMIDRIEETQGIQRNNEAGGLIIGETGTRNIVVSAGTLWSGLTKYPISAINTVSPDDFKRYYRDGNGTGGQVIQSAQTQWNNTQYDDGSGTLVTMTANRHAVQWFWLSLEGDLLCQFGTDQYLSLAAAEDEGVPTDVPDAIGKQSRLIGRIIFQRNAGTASAIQSAFTTTFEGSITSDHGNLSGLADDDHTQYVLRADTTGFMQNTGDTLGDGYRYVWTNGTFAGLDSLFSDTIIVHLILPDTIRMGGEDITSLGSTANDGLENVAGEHRVNVDDASIEISSDEVAIKDGGILASHIDTSRDYTFGDGRAYINDSTTTDSSLVTKRYVDDAAGLVDPFFIGEFEHTGNQISWGVMNRIDTSVGTASNADTNLWFPQFNNVDWDASDTTACIGDSGLEFSQALHPSIIYRPNGFGPKKWTHVISYTPICESEADENPHIAVSYDGRNWFSPYQGPDSATVYPNTDSAHGVGYVDSTLQNPIFTQDDFNSTHLSDPDIFFGADGTIWLGFRATWELAGNDSSAIFVVNSDDPDLVVWNINDSVRILSPGQWGDTTLSGAGDADRPDLFSPSFILDTNGTYSMWTVERQNITVDTTVVLKFTAPEPDSGWSRGDTILWIDGDVNWSTWHLEVIQNGADELLALATEDTVDALGNLTGGINPRLSIAISRNGGETWTTRSTPILEPSASGWDDQRIYRSTGYWIDTKERKELALYYSAYGDGDNWATGLTTLEFPSALVDTANDVGFQTYVDNNSVMTGDTVIEVVEAVLIHGGRDASEDSVRLSLESYEIVSDSGINPYMGVDSLIETTAYDTILVSFPALPEGTVKIDSVFYVYKSDGASFPRVNSVVLVGPAQTGPSVMADSSYVKYATTRSGTAWALVLEEADVLANARDQFALRIETYNSTTATSNLYIGRAYITCKVLRQ